MGLGIDLFNQLVVSDWDEEELNFGTKRTTRRFFFFFISLFSFFCFHLKKKCVEFLSTQKIFVLFFCSPFFLVFGKINFSFPFLSSLPPTEPCTVCQSNKLRSISFLQKLFSICHLLLGCD